MNSKNSSISDPAKTVSLKKSRFSEMLIEENDLDQGGFEEWIFCRGMLFNSPHKWWGDHGRRNFPHEGIDLCLYTDHSRGIRRLDEKTRLPVMYDGVVKSIFKDYLGRALIIEHEKSGSITEKFISIYAHTKPRPGVEVGVVVKEGDIIATIADTDQSKSKILPHLHFSLGLTAKHLSYDGFVWNTIRKPEMIILQDPLAVMDRPYQTLDADNLACREL